MIEWLFEKLFCLLLVIIKMWFVCFCFIILFFSNSNQKLAFDTLERLSNNNREFSVFLDVCINVVVYIYFTLYNINRKYCLVRPEARGLTLNSFIIKPMQRICKYPLLLRVKRVQRFWVVHVNLIRNENTIKELVKNSTDDAERALLEKAQKKIEQTGQKI